MSLITPFHLGGHHGITHTDAATLVYLQDRHRIRSMVDVGCGPGGMLDLAATLGIEAWGVDGDPSVARDRVRTHDYTTGALWHRPVDLTWSVEFVEHVHERFIANFLMTFKAGRVLMMTHALPGQGGHHHVNEQPPAYWQRILLADGWMPDDEATNWIRHNAMDIYVQQTGMVWTR